jgi:hypothetical protein
MMAKILNTIIVMIMIALIATFIVSALSLQSKTDKILSTYSARREELAARQQQIQDMIVSLNSTLQAEMTNQQAIASDLGIKINSTISAPQPSQPVVNTNPVVSNPPPQPPVVTQPTPRIITRAS